MADDLTPEQRHRCMAAIRSKHTKPEMVVRQMVHRLGRRFRLHRKDLPGRPDLVLARDRKAIFVNGCFWHAHSCRAGSRMPASNVEYWSKKRARNVERDHASQNLLSDMGWQVLVLWECQIRDRASLEHTLRQFLGR